MTREYRRLLGVTGGYTGLQGFTTDRGSYKGLQGVARDSRELQGGKRGYRGLQVVTGDDKALQGVRKDYRNFFLTRTFPDTFSWSILHKNHS